MPKKIARVKRRGTTKRVRPRKRWRDDVEEDLKKEFKTEKKVSDDRQKWRKIVLEAKVCEGR